MRIYTIHNLPGADALNDEPFLIKEGFNWLAALLTGFWALWHGLWLAALSIFVIGGALQLALAYFGADDLTLWCAAIGVSLVVGFSSNDWRRSKLGARGYRFEGVVAAANTDAALRRWFDLHPPGVAPPRSSY